MSYTYNLSGHVFAVSEDSRALRLKSLAFRSSSGECELDFRKAKRPLQSVNVISKTKRTFLADVLFVLEVPARFELADNGVADRGLTTWLRHHFIDCSNIISKLLLFVKGFSRLF